MASQGAERGAEGCSAQGCCEDQAPERAGSGLPRNVLSERERRKRISVSCERLRALLPRFDGRREDMASVLEMSVQFLRLAGGLVPSQEQHGALTLSKETWHKWQKEVLQLAVSSPASAGAPGSGMTAPGVTVPQAAPSRVTAGMAEGEAPLDGPPALPKPCGLVPQPSDPSPSKALRSSPPWPPRPWQPPSPLVSNEAQSCPGQAGSLMEGADSGMTLDARSASGWDVEDGTSFLLSASPDWWLGSLEGRGTSVPSRSMVRSSLLDRAESSFVTDVGPSSQELPDGPLEPWASDPGCPSLALREEVESIFPDFFPC